MGLLERFGLIHRKARPVGQTLEKGRPGDGSSRRKNFLVKAALFAGLVVLTLAAFPRGDVYEFLVEEGDTWRQEPLEAPFDFSIYKDPETLEAERRETRYTTQPYFRKVADIEEQITANRDTVAQQLGRVFETYASYQANLLRGRTREALVDSLRYLELRRNARLKVPPEQWQLLLESYTQGLPGVPTTSRELRQGPRLSETLLEAAWELSMQLVTVAGVLNVPLDSVYASEIYVRNEAERTEELRDKENVYGLNEAYDFAQEQLQERFDDPEVASLAYAFFRSIFQPSLEYMRGETLRAWQQAEERIWPTQGFVQEGEIIVDRDQRITPEISRKLESLERAQAERSGRAIVWRVTLGQLLLTLVTYLLFFLYLFFLRRQIFDENRQVLLIVLLFAGIIGLFALALRLPFVAMYAVPVAIASVLTTVMFDSRVGLFATLTLGLIGGHLLNYNFEFAFATILAGAIGVFSVRDIKNRGQFFLSAGLVFLSYLAVLIASWLITDTPSDRFARDLLLVGINSFLLIMAYPLLWVFERSFDITTDLSLLELSDTNRPLLKELSLRAPGTFNHSLQVANLSEAAADAIGANALLTRVGALYHDVGKMLKPDYFVENQRPGQNPHDHLKPRMSSLIIASHVKEGLEMGRQYNLPQRVLKFVPMHHGTTRIEYFYRKAIEQRGPEEPPIQESEFRYPGPRPDSKESGILMLADSVEAASRSLSDPTHKRLETLVDMIFKARIEDGQLDATDLTFRDLNQIKETFLSMLLGIYHVRVKYPGQKETRRSGPPAARPAAARNEKGVVGIPEQSIRDRTEAEPLEEEQERAAEARATVEERDVEEAGAAEDLGAAEDVRSAEEKPARDEVKRKPEVKNGRSSLDFDQSRRAQQPDEPASNGAADPEQESRRVEDGE